MNQNLSLSITAPTPTDTSEEVFRVGIQIPADRGGKWSDDLVLANALADRIEDAGFEAKLLSTPAHVQRFIPDLLIAFHVDQTLELFEMCKAAKDCGAAVAVYALHPPFAGVRAYLESRLPWILGLAARLSGRDPVKFFYFMELLRRFKRADYLAFKYLLSGRKQLLEDLSSSIDYLLLSGRSEEDEIESDFFELHRIPSRVVPPPVELPLDADGVAHDSPYQNIRWDRHFFIAGPIESRKNQNFIVQIAQEVPDAEFVFAGQLNQAEPWYCAEFKRLIAESSNCRWVGHLPMKAQMNHIIFADAVLNSSWFEVFSLTNLHGYTLGTPIVSAMHSHDLELLQEGVIRYDPEEAADLLAALDKIPARWPDGLTEEAPINFDFLSQSWTGFDEFMKYVQKRHAEWK